MTDTSSESSTQAKTRSRLIRVVAALLIIVLIAMTIAVGVLLLQKSNQRGPDSLLQSLSGAAQIAPVPN